MSNESEQVGDLRLRTVVINVEDMERAVEFWTAALGYEKRDAGWDPAFMTLVDSAETGQPISLHQIRTSSCSGILTATRSASSTSPPIEDCRPTVDCSPRLLGT